MNERITLIVSDLHVGGGGADKGDDHVYHKDQFVQFLGRELASPEGQKGRLELLFNGDFLEFVQTDVHAFSLLADDRWCTELESLRKLNTIIAGHRDMFEALVEFQRPGNVVTIAGGNHDIDVYWPKVQARIRDVAGNGIRFDVGRDWIERYAGKLQIAHGHMSDVANRFENWQNPVVIGPYGIECLEMCPGTLFMVKFVNGLEEQYPCADNLLPVTKLAWVLLEDDKAGFASVGWMFTRLVAATSLSVLETSTTDDVGARLLATIQGSRTRAARLDEVLRACGLEAERNRLRARAYDEDKLAQLMFALLGRLDLNQWQALFGLGDSRLTLGDDDVTLVALCKSARVDIKLALRDVARKRAKDRDASVVVMGHTHQVDELVLEDGAKYFNPGCWTRYLELESGRKITLDDLKDELNYPYALNVVRVMPDGNTLVSAMETIDRHTPTP